MARIDFFWRMMVHKIVLFEGIPASGKSTLIAALRKRLAGKRQPILSDRFLHSVLVYDELEGRFGEVDEMIALCQLLERWDVSVVFVDVPTEVAISRDAARGKWYKYTPELIDRIRDLYLKYLKIFPFNTLRLDGTKPVDMLVEKIVKELRLE